MQGMKMQRLIPFLKIQNVAQHSVSLE